MIGDNTVLAQQTARYLMKCLRKLNKNIKLVGFESYLNDYNVTLNDIKFNGNTVDDFMVSGNHIKVFIYYFLYNVFFLVSRY